MRQDTMARRKKMEKRQKQQHSEQGLHPSASTSSKPRVMPSEPHHERLVQLMMQTNPNTIQLK